MLKWVKSFFKPSKSIHVEGVENSDVTIIENIERLVISSDGMELLAPSKKIAKVDLYGSDSKKFIGYIKPKENLVKRLYYSLEDSEATEVERFYNNQVSYVSLKTITQKANKSIILGNPGLGKTTELEQYAYLTWVDQNDSLIPLFRNLKNFTTQDTIESFLGIKWKYLDSIIFVFDGVDEISDIQDFTSKLETFISKLEANETKHKFLISCRTNVYEDIVKRIKGFDVFFLKDLQFEEGQKLLNTMCKGSVQNLHGNSNFESFMKNPFQIEIVADYIDANNRIPNNTADLWESYINKRLTNDTGFKLKKIRLNPALIKNFSRKISIINELMKRNIFNDEDLFKALNSNAKDFEEFRKNPLLDKTVGINNWFFEHRNIQEYFAAKALSEKELDEIINFIQIEDTGRTHPSLFNTITFLINLLPKDSEKYRKLIDWFIDNEPEILFRSEHDRISVDTREKVFQAYFESVCIEKTFWVNTHRIFGVDKIARFGNCKNNFNYLLDIVKNKEHHYRARYSAFELLAYFQISNEDLVDLKAYLIKEISGKEVEIGLKSQIIRFIEAKEFLSSDSELIDEVFEIFKEETNKQLNASLLSLIRDVENVDYFFPYLYEEFLRTQGIKKRLVVDKVGRGNRYNVERLILKFESQENFLNIIMHYFNDETGFYGSHEFPEKIAQRCIYFININKTFITDIIGEIKEGYRIDAHRKLFLKIIVESDTKNEAVDFLLNSFDFKWVSYLSACLVDSSNIDNVILLILQKNIGDKDIERFRNFIGNLNDRDLATYFHRQMSQKGIEFDEPVHTKEMEEMARANFLKNVQSNLDILFDKDNLLKKVKDVFDNNGNSINWEVIHKVENRWYEDNGHWRTFLDTPIEIIKKLVKGKVTLNFDGFKEKLQDDYVTIHQIHEQIKLYTEHKWEYDLSADQKDKVKQWVFKETENLDFTKIIKLYHTGSFSWIGNNYVKIKTIFFFQELLKFDLPKNFLINCVEFFELDKSAQVDESFIDLKKKINDDELYNKTIVDNLNNKDLFSMSLSKHIEYALDNRLMDAFPKIREFFKNEDASYNEESKLKKYVDITNDTDLLKECCINPNSRLYWSCIDMLMDMKLERDFCATKSLEYIRQDENLYVNSALSVLFRVNHIEAINYIVESLESNSVPSLKTYKEYNVIQDYGSIEKLFNLIYNREFDQFEINDYRTFFVTYLANISNTGKDTFEKIFDILYEIRQKLEDNSADLFHINLIIDDVMDKCLDFKSKPYTFSEALEYSERI